MIFVLFIFFLTKHTGILYTYATDFKTEIDNWEGDQK